MHFRVIRTTFKVIFDRVFDFATCVGNVLVNGALFRFNRQSIMVRLRTFLITPFLLLFLATVSTIGWISFQNVSSVTEQLASKHIAELGNRVEAHIRHFFELPARLAQMNRDSMLQGNLNPDQPTTLAPTLTSQLEQFPFLTFVAFAMADGNYVAASRPPLTDEPPFLFTSLASTDFRLTLNAVAPHGGIGELQETRAPYDPRERPFMALAAGRDDPYWYPVYPYVGYDSLGIGIAAPVRDSNGELVALAAADVGLQEINRFLQQLPLGERGIAFVAEPDGTLVASSSDQPSYTLNEKDALQRLALDEHPDATLQGVGQALDKAISPRGTALMIAGERHLYSFRTFTDPFGLELVIGVVLPESAFIGPIAASARQAMVLAVLAVLMGVVLGMILTRWIALPVESIRDRAHRLARGDFDSRILRPSPIREVNQLSDSFSSMAGKLRSHIDELEARVMERTQDLEEANRVLERLATLDGLTQIPNRRCFDQCLRQEWERAQRDKTALALIMCDVDAFKPFNDLYGHDRGDQALRTVARAFHECAQRPSDLAARFGGEEFVMVLANTQLDGALEVAGIIHERIFQANIPRDDVPGFDRVTVSLGVACLIPAPGMAPQELIRQADQQLYRAKKNGRNQTLSS